jgi:GalNAc5-diNAcBac-PP-undecaprenol beta-1,3-glucosyltransferase
MVTSKPVVSIIMATYNRANLIGETLDSIQNQNFVNWECLIIDDWSTDNTQDAIQPYLADVRIIYHKRGEAHAKGCPGARNYGLSRAQGNFVLFFDDDDIAHPDLLKLCIKVLTSNKLDFCRFKREVFFNSKEINFDYNLLFSSFHVDKKDLEAVITNKLPFNSCQVMWRKSCFLNNTFKEEILYSDDWECYSRLLSGGLNGKSIDKVLLYARKHEDSSTAKFKKGEDKIVLSTKLASLEVIDNLKEKGLITPNLFNFFFRRALILNEKKILEKLLSSTEVSLINKTKYRVGFYFYPILRPLFKLKGRLKFT